LTQIRATVAEIRIFFLGN